MRYTSFLDKTIVSLSGDAHPGAVRFFYCPHSVVRQIAHPILDFSGHKAVMRLELIIAIELF